MSVLVVITSYSRPQNVPAIIRGWREQTVRPGKIIVIDNSPGGQGIMYPDAFLTEADDVWKMQTNFGCPCHFYPALAEFKYRYVMFTDDDLIPGPKALGSLMAIGTLSVDNKFATIGQFDAARNFLLDSPEDKKYSGRSVPSCKPNSWVKSHITCRAHLVRQDLLYHIFPFRQKLIERFGVEAQHLANIHDDFLMCLGIQMGSGFPSLMMGKPTDPDERLFAINLDKNDSTSLWKRPNHFPERNRMVEMALEVGWSPAT